jgi:Ca-activated chloride channel family protein
VQSRVGNAWRISRASFFSFPVLRGEAPDGRVSATTAEPLASGLSKERVMRTRLFLAAAALVVVSVMGLIAQARGTIAGTVVDPSGTPLPGVTVDLTGPESRQVLSDSRGRFTFGSLVPGVYQVRFTLAGFRVVVQTATVRQGVTARLTAHLQVDSLQESVTVTGASPRIDRPADRSVERGRVAAAPAVPMTSTQAATAAPIVGGSIGHPVPGGRHAGPFNTEAYDHLDENPFRRVAVDPLSTFSIDVDTASYANVRRFLTSGSLPPAGAVRIEELINYFRFNYPQPSGGAPFSVTTEVTECPWNPQHKLALIGLQGRDLPTGETPPRNLVFLIDVSGSMNSADKLPLVRHGLRMLVDTLTARDRVAIVVYAGSSGLVLPSTPGDRKMRLHEAIANLEAGGSTNGAQGIELAYRVAREHFIRGGVNRVILATDGDFNVGITSQDALVRLIEEQRASGVFLSVLGVGTGNLKDSTMEKLADKGNGNYSYLDSLHEARKVLVEQAGGTLTTIAKDVKLQLEFNPRTVEGYRLIGYENRILRHEDFNDDKKDAGEIGAGHSVTALYEIVPAGVKMDAPSVDPLKYQAPPARPAAASSDELLTVKLRYKAPDADDSRLISAAVGARVQSMSANVGFASAVAEVGMLLRDSKHAPAASYDAAIARARRFRQDDQDGYRAEFVRLAELAASLSRMAASGRR